MTGLNAARKRKEARQEPPEPTPAPVTAQDARAVLDVQITEKDFQQQVYDLARRYGWAVYHTHDSRRSAPGFPDLILLRDDVLLIAELKAERGKVSAAQEKWLAAFRAIPGAMVAIWRPSLWKSIERVLRP